MIKKNTFNNFFILLLNFFIIVILYLIIDEEPIFDITDFSIIQLLFFIFSLLSLVNENILKSFFGQSLINDKNLYIFVYYYTNNLFIYALIIWGIFYSHHITPISFTNFDLVNSNLINFFLYFFNFKIIIYFIVYIYVLKLSNNFILSIKNILINFTLVFFQINSLVISVLDFSNTNITSSDINKYIGLNFNSKSSISYGFEDYKNGFEWHLAESKIQSLDLSNSMSIFGSLLTITYTIIFTLLAILLTVVNLKFGLNYKFSYKSSNIILDIYLNIFKYNLIMLFFVVFYYMYSILLKNLNVIACFFTPTPY